MLISLRLAPFLFSLSVLLELVESDIKTVCRCPRFLERSVLTHGKCGDCARCWWDLYYYAETFKTQDPSLNAPPDDPATYLNNSRECADLIPYPRAMEKDFNIILPNLGTCGESEATCHTKTDAMFVSQCKTIFDDKFPKPTVDVTNWQTYKKRIENEKWKPPPLFTGKVETDSYYYFRTCPSHHSKYTFTYYFLYSGAWRKYGNKDPKFEDWNDDLWLTKVVQFMRPQQVEKAAKDARDLFIRYGVSLIPRRFCGHPDVFVCIE